MTMMKLDLDRLIRIRDEVKSLKGELDHPLLIELQERYGIYLTSLVEDLAAFGKITFDSNPEFDFEYDHYLKYLLNPESESTKHACKHHDIERELMEMTFNDKV